MAEGKRPVFGLRREARTLLEGCPAMRMRAEARRLAQDMDRALAGTGLSSSQVAMMAQIATAEDDSLGALARRLGVDPSTLSRTLRTLEVQGLVEITIVETDLRRRAVWLTETGALRLAAALPLWRDWQARAG